MSERELFMQAYINLRSADSIPFPDAVFDEFIRLRQGYKLVPVEPTEEMIDAGVEESDVDWKHLKFAYQAMIGAVE